MPRGSMSWPLSCGPVESGPDDPALIVALDAPPSGQRRDDAEPSTPAVVVGTVTGTLRPRATAVFDLDEDAVLRTHLGAHGETATGPG
jgi:hypothetical protein